MSRSVENDLLYLFPDAKYIYTPHPLYDIFGKSINKLQVLRHGIAQLSSEIEALKVFSYYCCSLYDKKIYDVKLLSLIHI